MLTSFHFEFVDAITTPPPKAQASPLATAAAQLADDRNADAMTAYIGLLAAVDAGEEVDPQDVLDVSASLGKNPATDWDRDMSTYQQWQTLRRNTEPEPIKDAEEREAQANLAATAAREKFHQAKAALQAVEREVARASSESISSSRRLINLRKAAHIARQKLEHLDFAPFEKYAPSAK